MRQTQAPRRSLSAWIRDRGKGYERTQNGAGFDRLQSLRRAFYEPNAAGVLLLAGVRQSCTGGARRCMDHGTPARKAGRQMSTNGHRSAGLFGADQMERQAQRPAVFCLYTTLYTHRHTSTRGQTAGGSDPAQMAQPCRIIDTDGRRTRHSATDGTRLRFFRRGSEPRRIREDPHRTAHKATGRAGTAF